MQTVLEYLRDIIGVPDFYIENGNYSGSWDYGAMLEYVIAGCLVLVVVGSVFRILRSVFGR